ncbi:MAG: DUF4012 domain-containing protein, partial [Actinomycetota bacterium]|nr:DUF4012 domain-containing protein [Actinomycetota bacterium]
MAAGLATVGLAVLAGFTLVHVLSAASAGARGRSALTRAEANLSARDLTAARADLATAHEAFTETREEMSALGPVAAVARRIPVLGNQVKAVDTFASAGVNLAQAGQQLVDAADTIVNPRDQQLPISDAMDALRSTQQSLGPAVAAVTSAADDVAELKGRFLLGPLSRARDDLATRLPRIRDRATSAEQGLTALMTFAGDSAPKRYLFLSQNPDEVRPTGGFIGTYGVLTADAGRLRLERYDAIEEWTRSRPQADVPAEQAGPPFQYGLPQRRTLGNVNNIPDWPQVAQLAANLWRAGGEPPVDGVISFTPGFMAHVLSVVGPVSVPAYDETVDAENLHDRLEFHVRRVVPREGTHRKDFIAAVAEVVMRKLLDAPASHWEPQGAAMGKAFDNRQAMAWSADPVVARVLADRGWDGAFPVTDGDFFYNSEFQYVAKNARGIRRVYDHHVTLRADGGARITTTLTLTNTLPPDLLSNLSTLAYMTVYGPQGAVLDQAASDPFGFKEPALSGHPATGWFRAAAPSGGQTTLKVVWDVPRLAK